MKIIKGFFKIIILIVLVLLVATGTFIAYLSLKEYKPEAEEELSIEKGEGKAESAKGEIRILSFNIGYGGLGKNADFVLDGGSGNGKPESRELFEEYFGSALDFVRDSNCDVYLLQEVDRSSARSYKTDEIAELRNELGPQSLVFANNYRCPYVPFPWPPIGKVDSGLLTMTDFDIRSAVRKALPNPFSWPLRVANLKRAILLSYIAVEGSDKQLCLINLHLEAYTAEEGRREQQELLLEIMREEYEKGNWVIAGGDFNQSFPGTRGTYPIIDESWVPGELSEKELGESFSYVFDAETPTCRLLNKAYDKETAQHYIIDGFIISDNVELVSIKTHDLGFEFSDHNPVEIVVKLK